MVIRMLFLLYVAVAAHGKEFNFVTLGRREILISAGTPFTQAFYETLGFTCHVLEVEEFGKAAGSIGCLTSILHCVAPQW